MQEESIKVSIHLDGRMDTQSAAVYLGFSVKTLAMMRSQGTGPRFTKLGRIFYFKEDLDVWIKERGRVTSTAQARQKAV